ncbi:MAG: hypothetical protein ABEI52_05140, partial [Halobacteriaceae archaeon]
MSGVVAKLIENESALLEDIITESYVETQAEANIDRTYSYLHGESATLNLYLETEPIVEQTDEAVTSRVMSLPTRKLISVVSLPKEPIAIEQSQLSTLTSGRDGYSDARQSFRADVRDKVLTRATERAFQEYSNDELLNLVIEDYNPDNYSEAEKERMVDNRESEIKSALRDRINEQRSEEISNRVDRKSTR